MARLYYKDSDGTYKPYVGAKVQPYNDAPIKEDIRVVKLQAEQNKTEVAKKQDKLVSGQNLKTINGESLLGKGDISAMRPLFLAMPEVTWHPEENGGKGFYHVYEKFGGLTDVTEKQMYEAYSSAKTQGTIYNFCCANSRARFNLLATASEFNSSVTESVDSFINCASMEFIALSTTGAQAYLYHSAKEMFYNCVKLKKILCPIKIYVGTSTYNMFYKCYKLEDVQINNLAMDIIFSDSPLLSVDATQNSSVGYMILNAVGGSSDKHISITLHHDVYVKTMAIPTLVAKAQELFIDLIDANPA